ncbi:penicillin-binding protein [Candidatus Woesearchaeota archaeon]|nr:penicillin-binding protein [Candidatus Woesearchaeota archaeon]
MGKLKRRGIIRRNKGKLAVLGIAGAATLVGESSFGLVSENVGRGLSYLGDRVHSQDQGQYWQAFHQHEHVKTKFKGEGEKKREKDEDIFPDITIIEKWPISRENDITIKDSNGEVIAQRRSSRSYLSYEEIPKLVRDAFILREDRGFYDHHGVNWKGKLGAVKRLITSGESGAGSGLTEQVAKWLFTPEGKSRPARRGLSGLVQKFFLELPLAMEIDHRYSKEKIAEFYLNNSYFGNGNYGVKAAAQDYFGKDVKDLTQAESLFLAVLVNKPGRNPRESQEFVKYQRKEYLSFVASLHNSGLLNTQEYQACKKDGSVKINAKGIPIRSIVFPEIVALVDEEVEELDIRGYFGDVNPGFRLVINTSIDSGLTTKLKESVGILGNNLGNVSRENLDGGAVIMDEEARIVAIAGRRDYKHFGQVLVPVLKVPKASTIKPFIYATAYDLGIITPDDLFNDTQEGFENVEKPPKNWDDEYGRDMAAWVALAKSNNVISRRVYDKLVEHPEGFNVLLKRLEALGFDTTAYKKYGKHDRNNTVLGGRERLVSPIDMAAAYNVFNRKDNGIFTGDVLAPTVIVGLEFNGTTIDYEREAIPVFRPETIEKIRPSLIRVANGVVGRMNQAVVWGKTGTYQKTVYTWFAGGFELDGNNYSMAFLAMNERGQSIGDLFSTQVIGPVVSNFINRASPKYKVEIPTATGLEEYLSGRAECDKYSNPRNIREVLDSGQAFTLGSLSEDLGVCSELYQVGSRDWSYFKFYQGVSQEKLYEQWRALGYSKETVDYLLSAISTYKNVVDFSTKEDPHRIEAKERLDNLEGIKKTILN